MYRNGGGGEKNAPVKLKEGNVRLETEIVQTAGGCDVGTDNKRFVLSVMMEKWEEDAVEGRKGAKSLGERGTKPQKADMKGMMIVEYTLNRE